MKSWEYRNLPVEDRVLKRINKNGPNGCHIFDGAKDSDGYGRVKIKGVGVQVHRWIWAHFNGPIASGVHVLHRCDTPSCVNLDHLFIGDHAKNMADKAAKGRSKSVPRGFAHSRPMAKLTTERAMEIKNLLRRGYRQADIANDFKVSRQIVSDIACGKTWAHLK